MCNNGTSKKRTLDAANVRTYCRSEVIIGKLSARGFVIGEERQPLKSQAQ
jgi:hypothetical protein